VPAALPNPPAPLSFLWVDSLPTLTQQAVQVLVPRSKGRGSSEVVDWAVEEMFREL